MNAEEYEQEIDLKDLFFYMLYRWRLLLLAAVIGAAALGGVKVLKSSKAADSEITEVVNPDYEQVLENYETEKQALEQTVENLQNSLAAQNRYIAESPYMRTNPYQVYYGTADFVIETQGMAAESDMTNLIQSYKSNLLNGTYLHTLAEKNGIDASYLQEVVDAWGDHENNDSLTTSYVLMEVPEGQVHQGMLYVSVSGPDEAWVNTVLQGVCDEVKKAQNALNTEIAAHTIREVRSSVVTKVDTAYLERQQKIRGYVTSMNKNLAEAETNLKDLKMLDQADIASVDAELDKKAVIKYAVVGFLAGGFCVAFVLFMMYVLNDKVMSEKEIRSRFAVKNLGEFTREPKKHFLGFIDNWLRRLAGDDMVVEDDVVYDMIEANIRNYAGDKKHLLLTGLASEAALSQVSQKVGADLPEYELETGHDVVTCAAVRRQLAACEAVILVEEKGVSRYSQIQQELELAKDLGVEVLGVIVV